MGVLHEPITDLRQDIHDNEDGTYAWDDYEESCETAEMRSQNGLPVLTCDEGHQFVHQDVTFEKINSDITFEIE